MREAEPRIATTEDRGICQARDGSWTAQIICALIGAATLIRLVAAPVVIHRRRRVDPRYNAVAQRARRHARRDAVLYLLVFGTLRGAIRGFLR